MTLNREGKEIRLYFAWNHSRDQGGIIVEKQTSL